MQVASRPSADKEKITQLRELAIVSAFIIAISLILWWRFLPLPHADLGFYTEPAFLLAKFGTLAGPGSQYVDLTYQKGLYNYPPGHFLILAGWIKLFGLSLDSLLAYTHLVHAGILILLYALIRFRYQCTRFISLLALLTPLSKITHGRPDLTACLLSITAWLALPEDKNWKRIVVSGALAGATLLVSPAYGVGILSTLFALMLVKQEITTREKLLRIVTWGATAGMVFASVTLLVLWQQHSWTLAYTQFMSNLTFRGAQVNKMPNLGQYAYLFGILPFVVLAVMPAMITAIVTLRKPASKLRDVTWAFLAAAFICFMLNKSQLLLEHHWLFASKIVFLAMLCSQPRFPLWLRVMPLLIISVSSFYLYKANFLYIGKPLRSEAASFRGVPGNPETFAVDSLYFAKAYQAGHTLNYETIKVELFWPQYLAAIPSNLQDSLLSGLSRAPAVPSIYLLSAYTMALYGAPAEPNVSCTMDSQGFKPLQAFGRKWKLPAHPYTLMTCTDSRR
jgi:hypothetical protein